MCREGFLFKRHKKNQVEILNFDVAELSKDIIKTEQLSYTLSIFTTHKLSGKQKVAVVVL